MSFFLKPKIDFHNPLPPNEPTEDASRSGTINISATPIDTLNTINSNIKPCLIKHAAFNFDDLTNIRNSVIDGSLDIRKALELQLEDQKAQNALLTEQLSKTKTQVDIYKEALENECRERLELYRKSDDYRPGMYKSEISEFKGLSGEELKITVFKNLKSFKFK